MDMMDLVHVDEKWFFISKDGQRYIMSRDEPDPVRKVKHKSHITKVMFICAIARPRFVPSLNAWWDGKVGIWPVGSWEPAKRSSVNRPKGTMVWRNKSIDRECYRDLLMHKVVEGILSNWPESDRRNRNIRIQQDGAKSHVYESDLDIIDFFESAEASQGLKAQLFTQPANSPDCNICDLGFFRVLQSRCLIVGTDEKTLLDAVKKAFDEYPKEMINRTWLTLQSCLNCIIEQNGDNTYKIPHMNKEQLEKRGELPTVLEVTDALHKPPSESNLQLYQEI